MIKLSDYTHTNDGTLTTSTSDPSSSDDGFSLGTMWINTTTNKQFICTNNTSSNAVWKRNVDTHNNLNSKQGGTTNEYYHITNSDLTDITSLRDNSIVNALHRHSELVASDGSPDPALRVWSTGLVVLINGVGINKFSNNALSTSTSSVPTESVIKTYIDNEVDHIIEDNVGYQSINGGTNTTFDVTAGDTSQIRCYADDSSTPHGDAFLYVGQSTTYGGGIRYIGNNDASTHDDVEFFRRNNGTDTTVMKFHYDSSIVEFEGSIYIDGSTHDLMWASGTTLQMGTWTGSTFSEKMAINTSGLVYQHCSYSTSTYDVFRIYTNNVSTKKLHFYTEADGDCFNSNGNYGSISDQRVKENVVDCTPKLNDLNDVRVVNFNKIDDTVKQIGVIAQEIEQIFPTIVTTKTDEDDPTPETANLKSVKYSVLVPMLIKAVQELTTNGTGMSGRVSILENA